MAEFRILSLDGGGIRGVFSAAFLEGVERRNAERPLHEHFDLICGTSTGGIIALALGLGVSAGEILGFYRQHGARIFPSGRGELRRLFRPKYDQDVLRSVLETILQRRSLGMSKNRLVIPAYDVVAGVPRVFHTAHHADYRDDFRIPAVDVALATSAAPTYFRAFATPKGQRYIDGGVWSNCPAVLGVNDAIGKLGVRASDVRVLSVGTTTAPFFIPATRGARGLIGWSTKVVDLLFDAQQAGALLYARDLIGQQNVVRADAAVAPGRFKLDRAADIQDLAALGAEAAERLEPSIRLQFLSRPAAQFRPQYR